MKRPRKPSPGAKPNKMKTKLLFLAIFLCATNLFASEGLSAFSICRLCDPVVVEYSSTGIIKTVTSSDVGIVDFEFDPEQPDIYYEIRRSMDDVPMVDMEIRNRSTTGFTLRFSVNNVEADPSGLLIVAVDR